MRAGKLCHQITIQYDAGTTTNDAGQPVADWQPLAEGSNVWASIEQLTGLDLYNARQVQPRATHLIKLRWVAGVTPAHRISFGARTFEILDVEDIDLRNIELEIIAIEMK